MTDAPADADVFLEARGVLVDMDGVLVASGDTVERHWTAWADRRGLRPDDVLQFAHGAPSRAVIARFVPAEEVDGETAWIEDLAFSDAGPDEQLPGARRLLAQTALPVVVVTSATEAVARFRLRRADLPDPPHLVGADQVRHGKPDPEPYLEAAHRIGVGAGDCVAIEDSPAGASAAVAAGATTVAVLVSHTPDQFGPVAHFITDLSAVTVEPGGVRLRVS